MNILVIDAQGGGIGRQVVAAVKKACPDSTVTAVGTNTTATANMIKAGADHAATGENAVVVNSKKADVIIGPIGIAIADSMFGEVTPLMATAVGQSAAKKLFIPINQCDNIVLGVSAISVGEMIAAVLDYLRES